MIVRGLNQVSDLTKELAIYVLHMLHNENLIIRKVYSVQLFYVTCWNVPQFCGCIRIKLSETQYIMFKKGEDIIRYEKLTYRHCSTIINENPLGKHTTYSPSGCEVSIESLYHFVT